MSFAIFQAFGGLDKIYGAVEPFILENLAEGVSDQVVEVIRKFISNAHPSTVGISGLLGLIVTSMLALWSIEKAINRVWNAPMKRSWFARISSYWLFITIGPIALAVALGVASSGRFPIAALFPSGTGIFSDHRGFLLLRLQMGSTHAGSCALRAFFRGSLRDFFRGGTRGISGLSLQSRLLGKNLRKPGRDSDSAFVDLHRLDDHPVRCRVDGSTSRNRK